MNAPLSLLLEECQLQMAAYKRGAQHNNSASCAEIVRRAAQGDDDALATLLHNISRAIIEHSCRKEFRTHSWDVMDDLVQDVNLRLVRRFHNRQNPFQAASFAEYHNYLNLTIKSAILSLRKRQEPALSLEEIRGKHGIGSSAPATNPGAEGRARLHELLEDLLPPIELEVLYRRIIDRETPEQIAEVLRIIDPDMTKEKVYRMMERTLRKLKQHPILQQFMKDGL